MLTGLRKSWLLGLCSLLLCFASCHWEDAKKNGVDERQAKISVIRFDQMLNEYVESNSFSSLSRMRTECPQETRILLEDIIGLGEVDDERIYEKMKVFFSDTVISFREFLGWDGIGFLILPTYLLSQVLLTLALVFEPQL